MAVVKEVSPSKQSPQPNPSELEAQIAEIYTYLEVVRKEISKVVVGQKVVVDAVLRALLSNGHLLLEGVPGLAKTLLVRTVSQVMGCTFNRIQFTPDLLPTDILGITTYDKERVFYVLKGPIFANFILADEINRAPPKVQSALLESMQEKQATIGREAFPLPIPFFVLATQNPLESLGTYPLPEAQIDRFLFKVNVEYPTEDEEQVILRQNINTRQFSDFKLSRISTPDKIMEMQSVVKQVYLDPKIERYIIQLVFSTRTAERHNIKLGKYVEWGASPRASIGLHIAAKADAVLKGKTFVTPQNVKNVAHDVLRHRIIVNYEGQSENISTDQIISEILSKVPVP